MKMKKTLCVLLAAAAISTAALSSCGDSSSSAADNSGSASAASTEVTKDVTAIADKLKSDIKYVDTLNELSAEMTEKILGISADLYTAGKVYVGSGGATAEEIACFEAKDADSAKTIKEALEKRIDSQKKAFENYQPQEMEKLNSPVLVSQGNYVFMCLSDDNSKAEEIIG